jgi:hypothetical protein
MTSSQWGTWISVAWLCALVCGSTGFARAQDRDKAAAEALFAEGRKLMAAGDYAAACSKLAASQALDAGVGTQLNLADCYEKQGKTASAWAQFRETITAARNAGSPEREKVARRRAEALESQLSYLTIVASSDPGLTLTRDDARIDPAAVGSALPIDPGSHVITASAQGKQSWSTTVTVGPNGDRISVTVPALQAAEEDKPAPGVQTEPTLPPAAAATTASDPAPSSSSPQKLIGIIASGAGVAGLAVATYFGLQAAARWSDAKAGCDPYPYCGEEGRRLSRDAQGSGTISTVAFIAGGVLLAGGVVLWLSAPGAPRQTETALLVGPGSVQLRGSFQ